MEPFITSHKILGTLFATILICSTQTWGKVSSFQFNANNLDKQTWKALDAKSMKFITEGKLLLSVSRDTNPQTPQSYTKQTVDQHLKEGLTLLQSKEQTLFGHPAQILDLYDNLNKIQVRQILSFNGNSVAILTCTSKQNNFQNEVKHCHQALSQGKWEKVLSEKHKAEKNKLHWLFN